MGNTLPKLPQIPPSDTHPDSGQELGRLEEEDRVFTCEICIEPTSVPDKRFRNSGRCSHPFCTDCVIKYIRVKLEDDNVGTIKCPAHDCDRTLDPLGCATLVGGELFVRWCDVLCEAAIADLDRCYCPYRNCNVLIVNECGGNVKKSACPSCKRLLCFNCKRLWHAGFGCEDSGDLRDRNDVAFGRLVEQRKWMRCPRCRHFIELMEGCQIVRCRFLTPIGSLHRCGISFCYKCGKQVHQHWCRCDTTLMCCEMCFRICIVLIFLTFGLFFLTWEARKHKM